MLPKLMKLCETMGAGNTRALGTSTTRTDLGAAKSMTSSGDGDGSPHITVIVAVVLAGFLAASAIVFVAYHQQQQQRRKITIARYMAESTKRLGTPTAMVKKNGVFYVSSEPMCVLSQGSGTLLPSTAGDDGAYSVGNPVYAIPLEGGDEFVKFSQGSNVRSEEGPRVNTGADEYIQVAPLAHGQACGSTAGQQARATTAMVDNSSV